MSRIGKKEIEVPSNLKIEINDKISVSNGNEVLSTHIPEKIKVTFDTNKIIITRESEDKKIKSLHGLVRSLISNSILGFQKPFQKILQIKGIGYKASVVGEKLVLNVGYSHPVEVVIPKDIDVKIDAKTNQVIVSGVNKLLVGEIAAKIRAVNPPEPYKGTGIMYLNERIIRKAGKSASSGKK
jgi:large subunit ribosomal protein L6